MTLDKKNHIAVVKLNKVDQSVFSGDKKRYLSIPNAWGKQGWTRVELKKVRKTLFKDVLRTAYCEIAPKKLVNLLNS